MPSRSPNERMSPPWVVNMYHSPLRIVNSPFCSFSISSLVVMEIALRYLCHLDAQRRRLDNTCLADDGNVICVPLARLHARRRPMRTMDDCCLKPILHLPKYLNFQAVSYTHLTLP